MRGADRIREQTGSVIKSQLIFDKLDIAIKFRVCTNTQN